MHLILLWFAPLPPYHSPTSISPTFFLPFFPSHLFPFGSLFMFFISLLPLSLPFCHVPPHPLCPSLHSVFSPCMLKVQYVNALQVRQLNYSLFYGLAAVRERESVFNHFIHACPTLWCGMHVWARLHWHVYMFVVKDKFVFFIHFKSILLVAKIVPPVHAGHEAIPLLACKFCWS